MRALAMIWRLLTALSGRRTCLRPPMRMAATPMRSRRSSARSGNGWRDNLPERGSLIDCDQWGQPKLPPKAERAYGNPDPSHHTGWYLDERTGEVKSVAYRLPEARSAKVTANGETIAAPSRVRPDVTSQGP